MADSAMPSISDQIRALAVKGKSTADIARQLGIRYQHAYNVLQRSRISESGRKHVTAAKGVATVYSKPPLPLPLLLQSGFEQSARWIRDPSGDLKMDGRMRREPGVYAFVQGESALYVGLASMGLAKRLYFYARPGKTQRTSIRIKALLLKELANTPFIDIYTAVPANLNWNGLPISGIAGLEHGLISGYSLPWNIRGAR